MEGEVTLESALVYFYIRNKNGVWPKSSIWSHFLVHGSQREIMKVTKETLIEISYLIRDKYFANKIVESPLESQKKLLIWKKKNTSKKTTTFTEAKPRTFTLLTSRVPYSFTIE